MRTKLKQTEATQQITRRKHPRFEYRQVGDWDFFTYATGAKAGFIENVSEGGCLLRTQEPIDYRRWLRLIVKEQHRNIWFTAVGRVVLCETLMASSEYALSRSLSHKLPPGFGEPRPQHF